MRKRYKLIVLLVLCLGLMGQSCDSAGDQRAVNSASFESNNVVPEPSSALIFAVGLVLAGAYLRYRK